MLRKSIPPVTHPYHYLMHRYWGRKPHNIVSYYIKHFTKSNELVLDPFMGSGVVIIESLKLGRKVVGFDLNPISWFIVKNTIVNVDLNKFKEEYLKIIKNIEDKINKLYSTICPKCGKNALVKNTVWQDNIPKRIRGYCKKCRIFTKDVEEFDKINYEKIKNNFDKFIRDENVWYPKDKILKYVQRSGKNTIDELFSKRALISLGILLREIERLKEKDIRELMLLCFSSLLPNVSSLIPGNLERVTGRSGWVISKLYIPPIHTEKNVIETFKQRFKVIMKGKKELIDKMSSKNATIYNSSSDTLYQIRSKSIDYIFTDPPYGENIPYFGCSMLWNSWLKFNVDYENEIICDKYRNKDYFYYESKLLSVLKECYRVLKTGRYLTLTFNNRDFQIWKILLKSCRKSGFKLVNVIHQPQAVVSGTQGLNWKNTLRGDFICNFIKENNIYKKQMSIFSMSPKLVKDFILCSVLDIIKNLNGATTAEIYQELIPRLTNEGIFDSEGNIYKDIENILKNEFYLRERKFDVEGKDKKEYIWYIKK